MTEPSAIQGGAIDRGGPGHRRELSLPDLPAEANTLALVRGSVAAFADEIGLSPTQTHDCLLATYEAVANTVEHAYPAGSQAHFDVCGVYDGDTGTVTITITDYGVWKDGLPDPSSRRGRGLKLMRSCSDTVEIIHSTTGTQVHLRWNCGPRNFLPDVE